MFIYLSVHGSECCLLGDQEVWLVDAGESSRPASGITDLDIAMTVVKRVCQNYGYLS